MFCSCHKPICFTFIRSIYFRHFNFVPLAALFSQLFRLLFLFFVHWLSLPQIPVSRILVSRVFVPWRLPAWWWRFARLWWLLSIPRLVFVLVVLDLVAITVLVTAEAVVVVTRITILTRILTIFLISAFFIAIKIFFGAISIILSTIVIISVVLLFTIVVLVPLPLNIWTITISLLPPAVWHPSVSFLRRSPSCISFVIWSRPWPFWVVSSLVSFCSFVFTGFIWGVGVGQLSPLFANQRMHRLTLRAPMIAGLWHYCFNLYSLLHHLIKESTHQLSLMSWS